jgi:hypothetical protein
MATLTQEHMFMAGKVRRQLNKPERWPDRISLHTINGLDVHFCTHFT